MISMNYLMKMYLNIYLEYLYKKTCVIKIRRPASALLDKLLCPPGPGGPAATG